MADRIPLFCLHCLGGSARSWDAVAAAMSPAVSCVALDLPGFGDASAQPGADVAAMAAMVTERIGAMAPESWWIAGHSMGAKVALAVAREAESGAPRLAGLAGIALLAGSPPGPEPMSDDKRADLMRWIDGSDDERAKEARAFARDNVAAPLDAAAEDHAVADVLRANPEAWKRWLAAGSREDWRNTIGTLATPALVLSGGADKALGSHVQRRLMLPHLARSRHIVLEGAGHLLPIERPGAVARHLRDAMTQVSDD